MNAARQAAAAEAQSSWAVLKALRRTRASVRGKLVRVVLVTTLAVLVVSGIAVLILDLAVYRASWASDVATEAGILAQSTAPALAFDDRQAAAESLTALSARRSVLSAALYTPDGRLYASYAKPEARASVQDRLPLAQGVVALGERVEIAQPISHNGEFLGTIYLRARYDVMGRIEAYLGIFAVITALSLMLALALSASLQEAVTLPLEMIADVADRIVRQRDYSLRVANTTDDEIGIVVQALNNMLEEVQSRTRALEDSNARMKLTEEALRDADRRKDEFLATLAHELRNPLAPIRNAVRLLGLEQTGGQQRLWAQGVITRQVQDMALLLDDLLDVSRITRGHLELRRERISLERLVQAAAETARPLIDAKQHTLQLQLPTEPVALNVDALRISQVLCNLLNNAAKYTDAGGHIDLVAELDAEGLQVSVSDNGIGLSPDSVPRVFDMFSQIENALERSQGGLGIGLALARGLVTLHGGTIEARSGGVGCGSTFIVRLPQSLLLQPAAGAAVAEAPPAAVPRGKGRVLIADDNRDAADSLATLLRYLGYEVLVAYSGQEALDLALSSRPLLFVLDIGMPQINGYELATRLRGQDWARDARLIALTGWGQQEDLLRARQAGFDHHFRKPVDIDELVACLAAAGPAAA